MTLEELLAQIRARRICLTYSRSGQLTTWPGQRVPRAIRAALRSHSHELQQMIARGDIAVCENFDLHRQYWTFRGQQRYVCAVCERWYAA